MMGAMQGTADAGAYGDSEAFVMALHMDPLQIRISDAMAIAQDNVPKRKRGFMRPKDEIIPEVAVISDGHIVIRDYDSEFIRSCGFFRTDKKTVSLIEQEAPKEKKPAHPGAASDKGRKKTAGSSKSVEG